MCMVVNAFILIFLVTNNLSEDVGELMVTMIYATMIFTLMPMLIVSGFYLVVSLTTLIKP